MVLESYGMGRVYVFFGCVFLFVQDLISCKSLKLYVYIYICMYNTCICIHMKT